MLAGSNFSDNLLIMEVSKFMELFIYAALLYCKELMLLIWIQNTALAKKYLWATWKRNETKSKNQILKLKLC